MKSINKNKWSKLYHELFEDDELTITDVVVCSTVYNLIQLNGKYTYASNAFIANKLNTSSRQVSRSITKLCELEYLTDNRKPIDRKSRNRKLYYGIKY